MKRVRTILFTAALAKTKARNLGLIALCIVGLSMTTVVSADPVYVVDRSTTTGHMVSLEGTIEVSMLGDLTVADFVDWSLTLTSTTGLLPIEMTPSNSVWGQRSDLLITATESTLTITIASKTTFPGDPDGNIFNTIDFTNDSDSGHKRLANLRQLPLVWQRGIRPGRNLALADRLT